MHARSRARGGCIAPRETRPPRSARPAAGRRTVICVVCPLTKPNIVVLVAFKLVIAVLLVFIEFNFNKVDADTFQIDIAVLFIFIFPNNAVDVIFKLDLAELLVFIAFNNVVLVAFKLVIDNIELVDNELSFDNKIFKLLFVPFIFK